MSEHHVLEALRANSAAMNDRNLDRYADTFAEDLVWEGDSLPDPIVGPAAAAQTMGMFYSAFPDLHFEVEREFVSGDHGAVCWHATGTHQGELSGIPATGRRVDYHACGIFQVRDGKIARVWTYWDTATSFGSWGFCPSS